MRFVKKLEKVILAESVLCILTLTLIFVGWHFDAVVFFILIIQIMILIYTVMKADVKRAMKIFESYGKI